MAEMDEQLRALNLRVARLEEAVLQLSRGGRGQAAAAPAGPAADDEDPHFRNTVPQARVAPAVEATRKADASPFFERRRDEDELSVTQIMGWTGATLLVLAAAYLIKLVYDTGWLTPPRQIWLAVLGGAGLVATGLRLRHYDRAYASLLPAGGLVVFFLAIYGAHLHYHLIGAAAAAAAVIANCLFALWLARVFASEIYGLFAVLGSYSAPLLLRALTGSVVDLAIYFSAWSLVFCVYALASARRRPYLVAAYMALLAFQFAWDQLGRPQWVVALVFQALQFGLFLGTAIRFSIRHASPMTQAEAVAHLPLLLLFYGLQYALLNRHVPELAPWVALGSATVLLLAYALARAALRLPLDAGGYIVGAYCALVLFHAVYLELLPERWAPWAVLLALPPAAWLLRPQGQATLFAPFKLLLGVLLVLNYLRVVLLDERHVAGNALLLSLLYAAALYAVHFLARGQAALRQWGSLALYAAHIGVMIVVLRATDNALLVSLGWAALALATLVLAFRTDSRELGQSSLFVFAALLAKVILFDLAGAAPLVRIGSLVAAGISLYVGGLLYKRVAALET